MKLNLAVVIAATLSTLLTRNVVSAQMMLPASDECSTATNIPVTALPYNADISIADFTSNAQDLNTTSCQLFGRTMWWQFTPPTDGVLTVLTNDFSLRFGPGLDLNTATIPDSCENIESAMCGVNSFSAESISYPIVSAGMTYFIGVGETLRSSGSALFNFTIDFEPSNLLVSGDECADAIVISQASLPFNEVVDTRLYTTTEDELESTCGFGENSIFYQYTPTMNGLMIVSTVGSVDTSYGNDLDSIVSIFTGSCGNSEEVFCADQDSQETAYYPVTAGVSYTIKVGGYDYGGLLNFTLSFQRNYFNLVNEDEDTTIGVLNDLYSGVYPNGPFPASTINYANALFGTTDLSIKAVFSKPNNIQSVRLQLDNQRSICKNKFDDYRIYGENGNDDIPFVIGERVISATAYSKYFCLGSAIDGISQEFTVKGCDNIQYGLYDAQRDIYISNLFNGSMVSSPPCQVNMGVTFACGFEPKKVRLELRRASNNALVVRRDEFFSPYLLFSDNGMGNILSGRVPAGEYKLTAIIDGITHPSVTFNLGTCLATPVVDNTFDIDLRFGEGNLFENTKLFPSIVKRISSLIVGDRPDFTNVTALQSDYFCGEFPSRIDDLHICTSILGLNSDGVGGILGFLLNSYSRPEDNLPFSANVYFEEDDFEFMKQAGKVENYILQQLIRTLGLGDYWVEFGLATSGTSPCSYIGTKAKEEFAALTGCSSDIPLEQNSVPAIDGYDVFDCNFWDPLCLQNEVLTFTLGEKKISRVTLGALEDLGYVVNYTAADPYGPSDIGTCAGCNGNRNLKGIPTEMKSAPTSCSSGIVHERAVRHGRKMLRDVHEHHLEHIKTKPTPEGIVFTGNQRITVMYEHEDGSLCSVVVPADFLV